MFRLMKMLLIITLLIVGMLHWHFHLKLLPDHIGPNPYSYKIQSIISEPIITTDMSQALVDEANEYGYSNINGPTLIKVPSWINEPLGRYYLYFAHHKGEHIKMAYADTLVEPWTLYDDNILTVLQSTMLTEVQPASGWKDLRKYTSWSEARAILQVGNEAKVAYEKRMQQKLKSRPLATPHVASPEIFIDDYNQKLRLYFHGVVEGNIQMSKVAISKNGLSFSVFGLPYMRVFEHRDQHYALSMSGILYKSNDGLSNFSPRRKWLFDTDVRHSALYKNGDPLHIFYSLVGSEPERIFSSTMDISDDNWNNWVATKPAEVAKPILEWEGAKEPTMPSNRGASATVHQLRDPYVYKEKEALY